MPSLGPLLAQWERVAIFFVLRLTIAPCVESLILLDRAAYLKEQGKKQANQALRSNNYLVHTHTPPTPCTLTPTLCTHTHTPFMYTYTHPHHAHSHPHTIHAHSHPHTPPPHTGYYVALKNIFDPRLSPRNTGIIASSHPMQMN